ncbi:MAG: hypothetical protein IK082_05200 [Oscillospiraceae bacterium]|nr:hypothetical protein [Oscillospiraceae bacterium]
MIFEAMIILGGLIALGVVGGLERGLIRIVPAVVMLILIAAAITALVIVRKAVRR